MLPPILALKKNQRRQSIGSDPKLGLLDLKLGLLDLKLGLLDLKLGPLDLKLGGSFQDGYVVNHGDRCCPLTGLPLLNGRFMAFKWELLTTYVRPGMILQVIAGYGDEIPGRRGEAGEPNTLDLPRT